MNGGLYRSTHAAPDGNPHRQEGVTVVSVDDQSTPTAAGDQALPPENLPAAGGGSGGTAGQSAIMAVGSLVSRIIGFVRTALIGITVGKVVGDAYTSAQFLPNQIYELLLGGILSSVLVPLLVRRRKSDPDGGQEFTQRLLTFAVVSLGIATLLVVSLASVITAIQSGSDTSPAYRELVTHFAYLILPIIFFTGLSGLAGAVLNVRGHFAAPMWAPILNNIVVIATCGLFLLVYGSQKELTPDNITTAQIVLIGGGTLLGIVVQALGLMPALRKVGFRWRWKWAPRALGLREIGQLAGWMLVYAGANQLAVFLLVRVLSDVTGSDSSASILAFNNVFLLTMMAHGIVGVSVMTALLPKMSAAAAEGRYDEVSADLSRGIKLTSAALAPIVVVYAVLSAPISVFLFQGGRFSNADALATGDVLTVAAFAVIPLSISYLCTYAFYALQGNKTVALINLAVVAVRIGAYFLLAEVLKQSLLAAGMTAANALSYLISALISLAVLRRRIGRLNLGSVAASLARVAVAAGVAAGLGLLVLHLLPGGSEPDGRIEALVQLIPTGAVILIAYLAGAYLLRVREVTQVVSMVRRKIGR
ncbi:putative peptidoglycan lipid II flippase [Actinoplanes octamycinicus]|uniref:Putative peptidoglycan lipid II flippase n=1 Tax=Actinoplanes octamycinicus TaxID=135948 RepID=A0A7W7M5V1_9ACTN|nr:murein biosynthesis integral membrane protein MurJ [Actinoplanes octamycinicus]MBB4738109.1 putative peptidoglycan lipid II flippase [Actinoplanes octamycinicus]GIE59336.1 lipid II flippase MurJ [Actinoplanes octamycinicus]